MEKIQKFNMKNIPLLLDVVAPMWSPPVGDDEFKRFAVEYIIRNNIFENDYRFELVENLNVADSESRTDSENQDVLAAAFFARKGDVNKAGEWFKANSGRFPKDFLIAPDLSRAYIEEMDSRTFGFMNDDDIKLSLFISRKKGCGSLIIDRLSEKLRDEGWKNLYLWTDCECNWEWYEKHGYSLVEENVYEAFSSENQDYKTYIFKKKI